ncbi:hypothetical protein [Actinophytocola gossypii]|uniref:Transcriptional regulator, AbiEi antitoxin, Type IV TA system n=1 Tax=Actinophytocola gossypii TaxID=2812003 RepID=A0ABT2JAW0_9PSEU|nr:hypothetical protein [Actinophytocola gossypii]MCT2584898.1 hypothetical protein [Actinophytocola gossypii]
MTNSAPLDLDALPRLFRHQVATATDLVALGLTRTAIDERCGDDGPWRRLQPGLVLLRDGPPSRAQRVQAALTIAGPDAVLTGVDALVCHGLTAARLEGPVHVLIPPRRHSRLVDGVFFDRTHTLPVPQLRSGFPVAPPARATADTCRRAKAAHHVRALLLEAIRHGRVPPAALRAELAGGSSRGTALPGRILAEIDDGASALAKGLASRLVRRAGLPTPRWRAPICGPTGVHLATPDAWWAEVDLAWEITAHAFEPSPAEVHATLRRASRLAAAGILVIHTPPTELRDNPARVADLLRDAHDRAAARVARTEAAIMAA